MNSSLQRSLLFALTLGIFFFRIQTGMAMILHPIVSGKILAPYYVDAITGAGNNAHAGTISAPWATLAHADSVLPLNYSRLYIKYPNGDWYSAPPIWHGFLSYYPYIEGTFSGANQQTLYDVFNGHNGSFLTTSAAVSTWGGDGSRGLGFGGTNAAAYSDVTVPNFASFGPTSSAAFIVAQVNNGSKGQSFDIGGATNPRISTDNPYTDGNTYFDFGSYTGGRVSYSQANISGAEHIWGFLAGGNYQAIYLDSTREAFQNSNLTYTADSNTTLNLGYYPANTISFTGSQYGLMITNSTLPDASYLALENWFNKVELPRTQVQLPLTTLSSNGLESVPSMGWDSWRAYGVGATEAEIKANADAMVSNGMLSVGYQYVTPNDNWASGRSGGALTTNVSLYPDGMAALGTYIHADGLKYGFYASPAQVGCSNFPGSAGNEATDATQFASFGIDLLMYDNCSAFPSNSSSQYAYQTMAQALRATGRNIVYRVSTPYPDTTGTPAFYNSLSWGSAAGGNEVWSAPDLGTMSWTTMTEQIDQQFGSEVYTAPGRYNIIDFLGVGDGTLTDTEGQSNISLWSIFASPLWASIALPSASSNTLATLENTAVIAVDQDSAGIGGKRVSQVACGNANCEVYARQLSGGAWAVALFNRASTAQTISSTWTMFGQTGPFTATNIWGNWPACPSHNCSTNIGTLSTGYSTTTPSHGVVMLELTPS